jgi:hypothetical protein
MSVSVVDLHTLFKEKKMHFGMFMVSFKSIEIIVDVANFFELP